MPRDPIEVTVYSLTVGDSAKCVDCGRADFTLVQLRLNPVNDAFSALGGLLCKSCAEKVAIKLIRAFK